MNIFEKIVFWFLDISCCDYKIDCQMSNCCLFHAKPATPPPSTSELEVAHCCSLRKVVGPLPAGGREGNRS